MLDALQADEARLALGVLGARLDRDLQSLLIFLVGVILFRVAAAVYFFADLLVPAAPVVVLAGGVAISRFAPHTSRRVVGQWGGAGGAINEEHRFFEVAIGGACGGRVVLRSAARATTTDKNGF